MEAQIRHLEMIQAIIARMAANSFLLKGWSVTLVAALFALAARDSNSLFIFVAYVPCISFWILDGYYLRQEKLFRRLYDAARIKEPGAIDFSMNTAPHESEVDAWPRVMVTKTLSVFYGVILTTVVVVTAYAIVCR